MKKLILFILIPLLAVSCSTDTLDWMYGLTSKGKENVLFHGDLERLSDGVLEMTKSTCYQDTRTFSSVEITGEGIDGSAGNIIGPFSDNEEALLYSLVVASQNQKKYEAVRKKIAKEIENEAMLNACSTSVEFYNSLLTEMIACLEPGTYEYEALFVRVLDGFVIKEEIEAFTYKDVIALKVLNSLLSAFLSYDGFKDNAYNAEELVGLVLDFNVNADADLNAYIANVTGALGEARNIIRTIGDGPVLTASAVASVLDVFLELL